MLTETQIRRGYLSEHARSEGCNSLYLALHNFDPKPFVWVKTVDDILANIAAVLANTEAVEEYLRRGVS